jgi:DNA-binding HxlR family transcriptional regulator
MEKIKSNQESCPIVKTMKFIGGKWKPIILARIEPGNVRFGRLTVQIPSISRKILSQQLKELETDGLILRYSYNEKPPRVEYELSPLGKTLIPVLQAMNNWAEQNAVHLEGAAT